MNKEKMKDLDPTKERELRITMDEDLYKELEAICFQEQMTVAGAVEQSLKRAVRHPEDTKHWLEMSRREGFIGTEQIQIKAEWV